MDHESENIFDRIKEVFGHMPENLSILEEQIDIEIQMDYFKTTRETKLKPDIEAIKKMENLFEDYSISEKKQLLVELAGIDDIEAYRTIEKYKKNPDPELRDWSILALRESKMMIESSLLDEHQIIISTGLGGKRGMLRYFVVIFSKDYEELTDFQTKIISNEFEYTLTKFESEIEEITNYKNYITILCVLPLNVAIKDIFLNAIKVCNEYGNFLHESFIITNVKILNSKEILKYQKRVYNTEEDKSE